MEYKQAYKSEIVGSNQTYGIDIKIGGPSDISPGIKKAARQAAEIIEEAFIREFHANNEASKAQASDEKIKLLDCFSETLIYVEAIPNGYCDRACCEHLPWFKVTCSIGPVIIGWRKRVIVIDWSGSQAKATAAELLFPDENVTKEGRMIHAWSYEKANEYISKLLAR